MTSEQLRDELESAIGHYVVDVADWLLGEGLPVTSVHAYGAYDDICQSETDDVEGGIEFGREFQDRINPGHDAALHWTGTSGWCLFLDGGEGFYDGARWLGADLLPPPERVAAFVSVVQLDAASAGSGERPFYRTPQGDLSELLERLAGFTPQDGPYQHYGYTDRFATLAGNAYRRRVIDSLVPADDGILQLPIRKSEVHALMHMLAYLETIGSESYGPYDFVSKFHADLRQRLGQGPGSAQIHRLAAAHALEVHELMEKHQQRKRLEEG